MRRIVPILALVVATSSLAPAGAEARLPREFFGVVPQTALTPGDAERMRRGGVDVVRAAVYWAAIDGSARSDYDWRALDRTFETTARAGLAVLPFVYATPRWLAGKPTDLPVSNGRQRRAWADFLRAAVERYGRGGEFWAEHGRRSDDPLPPHPVRAWQVWNEENFFYFATPASPRRYARLLAISRPAIERADPQARIVLGGLFGDPRERPPRAVDAADFLAELYRVRGVKANFDGVALHPYASDAGVLRQLTEELRGVMVRNGDRRSSLYLTEVGWGSQRNPRRVAFEVGRREQARELRRAYLYLIANRGRLNLKQIDWFTWKDVRGSCSFCDSTGLFRRGRGFKAKPAWHAFVRLAR